MKYDSATQKRRRADRNVIDDAKHCRQHGENFLLIDWHCTSCTSSLSENFYSLDNLTKKFSVHDENFEIFLSQNETAVYCCAFLALFLGDHSIFRARRGSAGWPRKTREISMQREVLGISEKRVFIASGRRCSRSLYIGSQEFSVSVIGFTRDFQSSFKVLSRLSTIQMKCRKANVKL